MEKLDIFKGIKIESNANYFLQANHLGLEGSIEGVSDGKLVLKLGRVYDLREVIGFGYTNAPKYDFDKQEIPIRAIRTFRKM